MILKLVKKFGRLVQGFLERYVLGGFIQKCIWSWRHLYRKDWAKISLESKELSHRDQLVSCVTSFDNVQSVLEIGCAAGPNLRRVRQILPNAHLVGIDINKEVIRTADNYFRSVNDDKFDFFVKRADQLSDFGDKVFEIAATKLKIIEQQHYILYNRGILKIDDDDIYSTKIRGDIYVTLHLH